MATQPNCGQRHPAMPWLRCTLPPGHDRDHLAEGSAPDGQPQVTWPKEDPS